MGKKTEGLIKTKSIVEQKEKNELNKKVTITTFGTFDVKIEDRSIFSKSGRKYKNLELFKFFITHRNRKVVPDVIIDYFWQDKDYEDPKNALSTQVHRLKKLLKDIGLMQEGDFEEQNCVDISFKNGFYVLKTGDACLVDADEFVRLVNLADSKRIEQPEEAIEYYQKALALYNGQYLEENLYSEWAIVVRNKYHRVYIHSVLKLLELLKQRERYEQIVELVENVIYIEPYEETFHIYFLEALFELKEFRYAISHYNYLSTKMYRDVGVKPSSALRNIYRKLLRETSEDEELDPHFIDKKLTEEDMTEGTIICEPDFFKFVYSLEKQKGERYGNHAYLLVLTLIKGESLDREQVDKIMEILKDVLWMSLRKSDLVTRWNANQILVLVINKAEHHIKKITQRIEQKFKQVSDSNLYKLRISCRPVTDIKHESTKSEKSEK